MQGYKFGDRLSTGGYWNSWWDHQYKNRKYNNIYDPESREYNRDNKWHPYFGWGFTE